MEEKNNAVEKVENIEKDTLNKKTEKQRKKMQKKRIKEQRKDEKIKAQLALRRERSRILAEKEAQKQKIKAEREQRKDELKKQRALEQENRKNKILENRQKNRNSRRGLGGWITAVVSLSVITFLMSAALCYTYLMPDTTEADMNSLYEKSFYDTVDQIDNIDSNLSKAIVTSDINALQKYLVNTAINSELAENDIGQLPLQDESKFYTTKLINQIGDFSKYLNNKIIDGKQLTDSDYVTLKSLYDANKTLKNSLQKMNGEMGNGFSFMSLINEKEGNVILADFNELQNLSVEYPELIYDGPFSDGADEREIKGLKGAVITSEIAKQKFVEIFGEYGLSNIKEVGESTGSIECFNVEATVENDILYAQFAKQGGELLMFAYSGSCKDIIFTRDEAEAKASAFIEGIGLNDMTAVWINLANNVYTINYAYNDNGVIVYSDLVKIRVCAETGKVIGLEATSYYTNHTDRVIGSVTISESEARKKVSTSIEIESSRICIVPIGETSEKLCYEFSGRYDGTLYYVYIDASNGRQVEMFKVIDSEEGELLI